MAFTAVLAVASLAGFIARFWLVRSGYLFGAERIVYLDIAISALLILTLAAGRRAAVLRSPAGPTSEPSGPFPEWIGLAATMLGIPALVIALANLIAPSTPAGLSPEACGGAPAYGWDYYGVTTGPIGNYARTGPGLSYSQSDRFDPDCTLGFVGYCLGDPVEEAFTHWMDTRWLLVGNNTDSTGRTWARSLSGETGSRRFVSHAYVAPKSPDSKLTYLGDEDCALGRPRPGKVHVDPGPVTEAGVVFELRADNAERIGLAISVDRGSIRSGGAVRRVYSEVADSSGSATVIWNLQRTLQSLVSPRPGPVFIAVLAVACLGPVAPAEALDSEVLTMRVDPDDGAAFVPTNRPNDEVIEQLRRAACDSEKYAVAPTPSPSASSSN